MCRAHAGSSLIGTASLSLVRCLNSASMSASVLPGTLVLLGHDSFGLTRMTSCHASSRGFACRGVSRAGVGDMPSLCSPAKGGHGCLLVPHVSSHSAGTRRRRPASNVTSFDPLPHPPPMLKPSALQPGMETESMRFTEVFGLWLHRQIAAMFEA